MRHAANGIRYAAFGDNNLGGNDLERMVQAVPIAIAGALTRKTYYFVPLALSDRRGGEATLVAPAYTPELGDQAICHRNVTHDGTEGVFISTRLLGDRFALAFEFFINVGHAFVDVIGVPEAFDQLVWSQAVADVRGETSRDAWESRNLSLATSGKADKIDGKPVIDEKARNRVPAGRRRWAAAGFGGGGRRWATRWRTASQRCCAATRARVYFS